MFPPTSDAGHDDLVEGLGMDFSKLDGLIPAVVQDATSNEVLMVGFMNDRAWAITQESWRPAS